MSWFKQCWSVKFPFFQLDTLGGDPLELLSYLGPADETDTPPNSSSSGASVTNTTSANNEDILSLFDS